MDAKCIVRSATKWSAADAGKNQSRSINHSVRFLATSDSTDCCSLAIAAGAGVFIKGLYRDTAYYRVMAVGQDFFSLTIITPMLLVAALMAHRTSLRALFVWIGIVTYLIYTYAIAAFDRITEGSAA